MSVSAEGIKHYAARAQAAILAQVDAVEDCEVRSTIRATVLDQIELMSRRLQMDVLGVMGGGEYRDGLHENKGRG